MKYFVVNKSIWWLPKSINHVFNNIEEVCSSKVYLSHKLKINVDEYYEVILTHYPLWNNEPFLYMICDKQNKIIIEKDIPESLVANKLESFTYEKKIINWFLIIQIL